MELLTDVLTTAEENYLKAIYSLQGTEGGVNTNAIAEIMQTRPASVSDMLRRLSEKELVDYTKYKGVRATEEGERIALILLRKHRLWETFLVEKLGFKWDEVHEVAEQLEHVRSTLLIDKLDELLGRPKIDPHGDPIPDAEGRMPELNQILLSEMKPGEKGTITAVGTDAPDFLQYLERVGLRLGTQVEVVELMAFDGSAQLILDGRKPQLVSLQVRQNLSITQ